MADFYVANSKKSSNPISGYKSHCKACVLVKSKKYYATPEGRKYSQEKQWRDKGIDMDVDRYEVLLKAQDGVCAICKVASNRNGSRLCVDHDHKTGNIRGLLCHYCNTVLGKMNDDVDLLQSAISYLLASRGVLV